MKMYTVEVSIDDRKFTRTEVSYSAYDVKMKYLDLYPNATVRVVSNSKAGWVFGLFGVIILMAIILFVALFIS